MEEDLLSEPQPSFNLTAAAASPTQWPPAFNLTAAANSAITLPRPSPSQAQPCAASASEAAGAASDPQYVRGLNAAQRSAVVADIERPLSIVAGAGSGKTSVLTRRIQHILAAGVPPSKVLAVTFTKAASEEMSSRLEAAVGKQVARAVAISTFHSLSLALCRSFAHLAGRQTDFAVRTPRQQLGVVRQALREERVAAAAAVALDPDAPAIGPAQPAPARDTPAAPARAAPIAPAVGAAASDANGELDVDPARLLGAIMRAKARGLSPADHGVGTLAARVHARYDALMLSANAFDFLDFLLVGVRALSGAGPECDAARAAVHARHTHLLVDEFQDSNALQLRLIRLLCQQRADGAERVTVVGDDDQVYHADGHKRAGDGGALSGPPSLSLACRASLPGL